jgi:hypothetical protein
MTDNVDHPTHYTGRNIGYECIILAKHQYFCTGNVIKYLWRYQAKGNPVEDLKKARWYARKAAIRHERTETSGKCGSILRRLIETTTGYESAAWYGLLKNEWRIVLSSLDAMLERTGNDTQTL